ncbi:lipoprotein [Spiroplasma alleghenense]|uniref:Lipoprotein n=1 Tax=Spiroplasma alleghenense TaxID=216931 RepID=A0A345Z553_9MOLU|nr:lipoprotein [Spiroplasma alleghenense]AXK51732.1 hypothetical protein SALLE_v1c10620 [Spiroplasma alleghenense]
MKKLLSILGAATLVVSAPLSVISCKEKGGQLVNDFDYSRVMREFVDNVTSVFKGEISNKFNRYQFFNEEDLPSGLDNKTIIAHKDEFEKREGKVYDQVVNLISDLIPRDEIDKTIKSEILTNVNYNPVLLDKSTPLKDGIWIDEIDLNPQTVALTLSTKISSNIYLRGKNDEKILEPISTFVTINIFSEKEKEELAKKFDAEYTNLLNIKLANKIEIISNSGNLDKTAAGLSTNLELKKYLKDEIKKLQTSEIEIQDNNITLKAAKNGTIDAGTGMYKNMFDKYEGEPYQTFLKSVQGEEDAEKILLENITGNDAKWLEVKQFTHDENAQAVEDVEKGLPIAKGLNQYALIYKARTETIFERLVRISKSTFKIDAIKDTQTIAVFATELSGLKFRMYESDFAIAPKDIFVRQKITEDNTLDYFNKFMAAAWNFQKAFLGAAPDSDGDVIFNLQTPETWKKEDFLGKTFTSETFPYEELLKANPEATKADTGFNFSQEIGYNDGLVNEYKREKLVYVSKNADLFFYSNSSTGFIIWNSSVLITSLFPDVIGNGRQPNLQFHRYRKGNSSLRTDNAEETFETMKSAYKLNFLD